MEKIIVNLIRNSHEINLKGTILALHSGNITKLKLRHNMRLMNTFAVKGVEALARERQSLGDSFEHMTVRYYDISSRYCLNADLHQTLVDKFSEVLDIDIVKLSDTLSPLGTGKGGIMLPFDTKRPEGFIDSDDEADIVSDSSDSDSEESLESKLKGKTASEEK